MESNQRVEDYMRLIYQLRKKDVVRGADDNGCLRRLRQRGPHL